MSLRFERVGGVSGGIAVALLATQFVLASNGRADPASDSYAATLLQERWRWEWVTLLRMAGGLALLWFTAGTVWAGIWLLSALFNSIAITFANHDAANARFAGTLSAESLFVLTPGITLLLLAATSLVAMRSAVFPRPFAYGTLFALGLRLVLAIVDWYGAGTLSMGMMDFALVWLVVAGTQLERAGEVAA